MARYPVTGRLMLALAATATAALAAAEPRAEDVVHWPCRMPYAEALSAEEAWGGLPPPAGGDWHDDAAVSELVLYATNPEINPDRGRAAIAAFARDAGPDLDASLVLAFHGMLEEMNSYYGIIMTGVRNFSIRARILEDALEENDAAMAVLPEAAAEERQDLRVARMWNFRQMDDAEEEAEFQCHRLAYLKKKLGLLTEKLRSEMGAP